MAIRELYIDRLRVALTALVILHHTAITYGASGSWFYNELRPSSAPSSLLLTLFAATNQAYFMGFFFLLAGYFTPPSLERKGYARYLGDRLLRLGLPLLFFILVLGPATAGLATWAQGDGFWPTILWLWHHQRIINGPLWFAQTLLLFALAYCGGRAIFGAKLEASARTVRAVPSGFRWLLAALGVGVAAWAIRLGIPVGKNLFGLQLGYFASYIFLFVLGTAAWRHDWLRQLTVRHARPWIAVMILALLSLPVALMLGDTHRGAGSSGFEGGLRWQAAFYALWEPFIAWGAIALLLLLFRRYGNRPSRLGDWLGRRAYAAYMLHAPVLVAVALVLHGWSAPALVKFATTGLLACAITWLVADPLVRLPGLRRVL
jgi:peptidoglycan/LPS O-acetylase OafA/YrhL